MTEAVVKKKFLFFRLTALTSTKTERDGMS